MSVRIDGRVPRTSASEYGQHIRSRSTIDQPSIQEQRGSIERHTNQPCRNLSLNALNSFNGYYHKSQSRKIALTQQNSPRRRRIRGGRESFCGITITYSLYPFEDQTTTCPFLQVLAAYTVCLSIHCLDNVQYTWSVGIPSSPFVTSSIIFLFPVHLLPLLGHLFVRCCLIHGKHVSFEANSIGWNAKVFFCAKVYRLG